jgi:L-threonylcarbamoyladenylate synthase
MKSFTPNTENITEAVRILKEGGVVAHPTDTCFGLAGDLMDPKTVATIQRIKGRDGFKPMSIMLPESALDRLSEFAQLNPLASLLAKKLLPGPVTLLLPKGPAVPSWYYPSTGIIGIRVPDHDLTQKLLSAFNGPLITTSANLSGGTLCFSDSEVLHAFRGAPEKPEMLFTGVLTTHDSASTVLEIGEDFIRIVRSGPVRPDALRELLPPDATLIQ